MAQQPDMPQLEGVEHHFVDVRGARLHVAELGAGAGPPLLLLLHGWPQHWWTWRELMPLLAGDFRVLAMDLRGFGWSEATPRDYRKAELADDVAGVLDALAIERVDLVGHDSGGVIGFLVCLRHGDRVRRYVPMNTGHVWPTLALKGVPKQLGAMAYQGLLASPGLGRRLNASPRVVGRVMGAIAGQADAVVPASQLRAAVRIAHRAEDAKRDPGRVRAIMVFSPDLIIRIPHLGRT